MKVDIFLSSLGEVGIVANQAIDIQDKIFRLDILSHQLFLSSNREEIAFNILPSPALFEHMQGKVFEIYWGVIEGSEITRACKLPLHVNGRFNLEQADPKFKISSLGNFETFLKQCTEGQPLHRDLFDDDDTKLKSVFEGVSPSLLKLSETMGQGLNYSQDYTLAPSAPAYPTPAPSLFGMTPPPQRPKASHVITGSNERNPMTYFVKKRHKGSFHGSEDLPDTNEIVDVEEILSPLMSMIGLHAVKEQVQNLAYLVQSQKMREDAGLNLKKVSMHMVFSGAPGTGKTTVAREVGHMLAKLGYLDSGHVIEVQRADLISSYAGESEQKTRDAFMSALDGILFIDEAYTLVLDDESSIPRGKEILTTLLKLMEDYRERVIVIVAGYGAEMSKFLDSNPGLRSRFGYTINFPNYTAEELVQIFKHSCDESGYMLDEDTLTHLRSSMSRLNTSDEINSFGNGRGVRNLFDKAIIRQASRIVKAKTSEASDIRSLLHEDIFPDEYNQKIISKAEMEEILKPLNELVGMEDVKKQISDFIYMMHMQIMRRQKKLPVNQIVLHSIFAGPPGTGKTTVARILGRILHRLGYLKQGHVVETDRSGLVGRWSGHTPEIVKNKFAEAEGGILFIDEAYSLSNDERDSFGKEAIDTILKIMEDRSSDVMVICAGYPKEMKDFLKSNPGLQSRFPFHLDFTTYKPDELITIFGKMCAKQKYHPTVEALAKLQKFLSALPGDDLDRQGNARLVRNIFERSIVNQSRRLNANLEDAEDLLTLLDDDIHIPDMGDSNRIGFF